MSGEKTEQPTDKRLRDLREKGQVPKSTEIPSAAVVMSLAMYLIVGGPYIATKLMDTTQTLFNMAWGDFDEVFGLAVLVASNCLLDVVGPLVPIVVLTSAASNLAQVGFLFSVKAAAPKIENLSPGKWFKKTFSKNNLFELLKNIIKVTVLGVVVYKLLMGNWRLLSQLPRSDALGLSSFMASTVLDLVLWTAGAFSFLAAVDFVWQRLKFTKDNMMTKDEVKREYKEMEGDPLIKSKRRQLHQEMASQSAVGSVKNAKVVVTNPTHYAVALDYEEGKTPLPIVLAKGEGELALRMIAEAEREGIPVLREASLARDLFENSTEYAYIPKNLIAPVAEVLRWLKELQGAR
ncbi:MAG: type III secretion system export apparatus subunit SctU [Deltaproteobacteria bacterium]|nr:type III secretion system export apparatus subunit SctU [Deltaproteobacteria bacterium]